MKIPVIFMKLKRLLFITVGLFFLVLGILGYILPGLPGTIWLILSATFFIRSSERLYNFVVQNRLFGHQIKEFLETGQMPIKAKFWAVISMWIFSIISLFAPYDWPFKILVILLAIIGTIYVISRPSKKS